MRSPQQDVIDECHASIDAAAKAVIAFQAAVLRARQGLAGAQCGSAQALDVAEAALKRCSYGRATNATGERTPSR